MRVQSGVANDNINSSEDLGIAAWPQLSPYENRTLPALLSGGGDDGSHLREVPGCLASSGGRL